MPQVLAMVERHLGSQPKRPGGTRAQGYGRTWLHLGLPWLDIWENPSDSWCCALILLSVLFAAFDSNFQLFEIAGVAMQGHSLLRTVQPKGNIFNHIQLNRVNTI